MGILLYIRGMPTFVLPTTNYQVATYKTKFLPANTDMYVATDCYAAFFLIDNFH